MVVYLQPQQGVRLRYHAVRVHVDRLHAATGHHHLAAPVARYRFQTSLSRLRLLLTSRGWPRLDSRPDLGGTEQIAPGKGDAGRHAGRIRVERFAKSHCVSLVMSHVMDEKDLVRRTARPAHILQDQA